MRLPFLKSAFGENNKDITRPKSDILLTLDMSPDALSAALGFEIPIFYLDEFPHASILRDGARNHLTEQEISDRVQWFNKERNFPAALAKLPFFAEQTRKMVTFGIAGAAVAAVPNLFSFVRSKNGLPLRLNGNFVPVGGVFFGPDRLSAEKRLWRQFTTLEESEIEQWPTNSNLKLQIFRHECGHLLQRRHSLYPKDPVELWTMERDADSFMLGQMHQEGADQENVTALILARALGNFLKPTPRYTLALALDAQEKGIPFPPYKTCYGTAAFLRAMVYGHLTGTDFHQAPDFNTYARDASIYLQKNRDPHLLIPALREVTLNTIPSMSDIHINSPTPANDLLQRTAEITLQAARYFCQKIANAPEVPMAQRPKTEAKSLSPNP